MESDVGGGGGGGGGKGGGCGCSGGCGGGKGGGGSGGCSGGGKKLISSEPFIFKLFQTDTGRICEI